MYEKLISINEIFTDTETSNPVHQASCDYGRLKKIFSVMIHTLFFSVVCTCINAYKVVKEKVR